MTVLAIALALLAIGLAVLALRHKPQPRFAGSVAMNDSTLAWRDPSGRERHIRLDDIHAVDVVTTDKGPAAEDYFFVLWVGDGTVPIPDDAVGSKALHDWIAARPGADLGAMAQAAACAENRTFPIWRR